MAVGEEHEVFNEVRDEENESSSEGENHNAGSQDSHSHTHTILDIRKSSPPSNAKIMSFLESMNTNFLN
ncbi:hypothetical protein ACLOJK_007369 [Asimina triloba]